MLSWIQVQTTHEYSHFQVLPTQGGSLLSDLFLMFPYKEFKTLGHFIAFTYLSRTNLILEYISLIGG